MGMAQLHGIAMRIDVEAAQLRHREMLLERRLRAERCPRHGIGLAQIGVIQDDGGALVGAKAGCPRGGCSYTTSIKWPSHG